MKVTLHFDPALDVDGCSIDADTYADIVSACRNILCYDIINNKQIIFMICNDKIITNDIIDFKIADSNIFIVPAISGGTAIDSVGNLTAFYGSGSVEMASISSLNRRILDSSLYGKATIAFDIAQRKTRRANGELEGNEDPSTGFGSISITSAYGQPIPLHFGLVRTAGAVINYYIKHIQRGAVDSVRVSDFVK